MSCGAVNVPVRDTSYLAVLSFSIPPPHVSFAPTPQIVFPDYVTTADEAHELLKSSDLVGDPSRASIYLLQQFVSW